MYAAVEDVNKSSKLALRRYYAAPAQSFMSNYLQLLHLLQCRSPLRLPGSTPYQWTHFRLTPDPNATVSHLNLNVGSQSTSSVLFIYTSAASLT